MLVAQFWDDQCRRTRDAILGVRFEEDILQTLRSLPSELLHPLPLVPLHPRLFTLLPRLHTLSQKVGQFRVTRLILPLALRHRIEWV